MINRKGICQKIISQIKKDSAFLVSDFYNVGYLSGFFPLSPTEREAFLLLTKQENFLLTDGRYINQVKALKTGFTCLEITSGQNFYQMITSLCKKALVKSLAFEKENLTYSEYEKLKKVLGPSCRLSPTQNIIEQKRTIKDNSEINHIRAACQIADKCFDHLLGFLKPDLTEKEVADEIEWFIRKNGAVDLSFDPIVASGPNSAFPHHRTGERKIQKKDILLLDFGAKFENYASDMTRVVFLGKASSEQKKVHQTVLDAQKRALECLNHGLKASSVDKAARDYITSRGYPTIPHSLGHGVGLSEHELPSLSPKSKDILKPGMVFSVEPGIYLNNQFGIRIEDLVALEKSGPKLLTQSPKKIIEL